MDMKTFSAFCKDTRICLLGLVLGLSACGAPSSRVDLPSSEATYGLHIKDARIVDGTGRAAYTGSVLVGADTLAYVGPSLPEGYVADVEVDAGGRVVAPGFIDAHAHGDPFKTPGFENFRAMGVTTILLGMDGSSPSVEDPAAYMAALDTLPLGVDVQMMVGHGRLREVFGADTLAMQAAIRAHLAAGFIGLSTGIEYYPGFLSTPEELAAIARPIADAGAVISSHVRSEDDDQLDAAIDELIAQGAASGASIHVSHLKIVYGNDLGSADALLAKLAGAGVTADVYPYTASYTGIGIVFPEWALGPGNFERARQTRREELATYLRERVGRRNGPEATLFGTGPWEGRTLAEVADSLDRPFEDVLIDVIGPTGTSAAYFVMNDAVMRRLLQHPLTVVSSDGSPTMHHPRGYGSFARVIEEFVVRDEMLSLEAAVHKMTGRTADIFGLSDRGTLTVGKRADIVLFDPTAVRARATFSDPRQLATGFDEVWVAGTLQTVNP